MRSHTPVYFLMPFAMYVAFCVTLLVQYLLSLPIPGLQQQELFLHILGSQSKTLQEMLSTSVCIVQSHSRYDRLESYIAATGPGGPSAIPIYTVTMW